MWTRAHGIIEVAVKTLHSDATPTDKLKFLQEGAITSQFRHPNVIFLHGIITDKTKVAMCVHCMSIKHFQIPYSGLPGHGIHVKRRSQRMPFGSQNRVRE